MKTTTIDMSKANSKNLFADVIWEEVDIDEVLKIYSIIYGK